MIKEFEKLAETAQGWIATPYLHLGDQKQGGVDCTRLIAQIFIELGLLTQINAPYCPKNWFDQYPLEFVIKEFTRHLLLFSRPKIDFDIIKYQIGLPLQAGDVMGMILNKANVTNHTALMLSSGKFIHIVDDGRGVRILDFDSYWQKRTNLLFRLKDSN